MSNNKNTLEIKKLLKKAIKFFLPYGIVKLYKEYKQFLYRYPPKNRENIYNIFISVGSACKPAYHLRASGLRYCASPLDWMMRYSLETVIHLFKT